MRLIIAPLLICLLTGTAAAQTHAQQTYRVNVPIRAVIAAPAQTPQLVHDETQADQIFSAQTWTISGNAGAGVDVSFAATTPFQHATEPVQRNAGLALELGESAGPAAWSLETASAQTDYERGVDSAVVSASSNGVGRAQLSVTVSFITDAFGTFPTGNYTTTVVGTVTAK